MYDFDAEDQGDFYELLATTLRCSAPIVVKGAWRSRRRRLFRAYPERVLSTNWMTVLSDRRIVGGRAPRLMLIK